MNSKHRVSIVIPARNEIESLPAVLEELSGLAAHEILVSDGHSGDGTPDMVRKLGHKVITQRGRGYGMGVISGIEAATGDVVTCVDADGSYDPEALSRMTALIDEGYDAVFCSRYLPESGSDDDTLIRSLGNWLFTRLARRMYGVQLTDILFFYALIRKDVLLSLDLECQDFSLCVEVPAKIHMKGYKYAEIPSFERPRLGGVSKVNAFTDGVRILTAMIRLKRKLTR
ncbi:MAG: glycosyltransferase family 2 protein [Rhodospirillaceae bacterium]|jgi:glycosyltransferase involved in cell wall biosynthesis|nr:glycosyltransferase family 2 protein [Rhodospirillaceae bacterium]MBT5455257.1 glycosyltransferase family 2 protein [Rhodospirillaceae bacterium]